MVVRTIVRFAALALKAEDVAEPFLLETGFVLFPLRVGGRANVRIESLVVVVHWNEAWVINELNLAEMLSNLCSTDDRFRGSSSY